MFRYQRILHLHDTDATGVIYFPNQLHLALEAFENFLRNKSFSFKNIIESPYLMPVVHAEADYMAPIEVDDLIEITLHLEKIGSSSFSLCYDFINVTKDSLAGTAKITHVLTLKETKRSVALPQEFRDILLELKLQPIANFSENE